MKAIQSPPNPAPPKYWKIPNAMKPQRDHFADGGSATSGGNRILRSQPQDGTQDAPAIQRITRNHVEGREGKIDVAQPDEHGVQRGFRRRAHMPSERPRDGQ